MNVLFVCIIVEIFFLAFLLKTRFASGKIADKKLLAITVLCFINAFASLSGFINLRGFSVHSVLFKIVSLSYGLECIISDYILIISAQYLLKVVKLRTKMTDMAFVLFWIFCGVDTLIFLTNGFTSFAYSGTLIDALEYPVTPVYFYHDSGLWMTFHEYFNLTLVLLIFISMLLKCSTVPLVYAGKYILMGAFFLAVSLSDLLSEFFNYSIIDAQITGVLMNAVPFVLYHQIHFYRPRFLLSSIRRMVFEKLGTPVVLFDDEDLLADFNSDASSLFNLEKSVINHMTLTDFLQRAVGNQMRERSTSAVEEVTIRSSNGTDSVFKLDYQKLNDKSGKDFGTLLIFHDITELITLYNNMEKAAMVDQLTGLASKVHLKKKITEINLYRKFPYTAVVCSINGINLISEGFGAETGNSARMHVADLLRNQLRASDFAASVDDNMVVLMPDTSVQDAEAVFKRISRILNHDRTFNFSLSFEFGIAGRTSPDSDMQLTVSQAMAEMLSNKMKKDDEVHQSIVDSLQEALRLSSFETEQHSSRVKELALRIAEKLNLPEDELENLSNLAMFHDIGKMSVPPEIINKSSGLTEEERRIIQLHVINGYKIAVASVELASVARGILCHHERWDGNGYPNGYAGELIPYLSRIVSVADAFDVMTHDRPYKVAVSVEEALTEIKAQRGKQFDPVIVDAFLSLDIKKV